MSKLCSKLHNAELVRKVWIVCVASKVFQNLLIKTFL